MRVDGTTRFSPRHRWDAIAFPAFVGLVWVVILIGFVPEIAEQVRKHEFDYPVVTHLHALAFVGWLSLLTIQTALIRTGRVQTHRMLGIAGACLVPIMVALGLIVSIAMFRRYYSGEHAPLTLSLRIGDMVSFGAVAGAALILRQNPAAHKRLMLLATFCLAAAGFGRWWGDALLKEFGAGFLGRWSFDYLGVLILILGLCVYDLITRRRLNSPFTVAAIAVFLIQLAAVYVRDSAWWKPISIMLIGR